MATTAIRESALVDTSMVAVERVLEYGQLGSEATPRRDSEPTDLKGNDKAILEFRDVSLRYDENEPLVLKNLTFKIHRGDKVIHVEFPLHFF